MAGYYPAAFSENAKSTPGHCLPTARCLSRVPCLTGVAARILFASREQRRQRGHAAGRQDLPLTCIAQRQQPACTLSVQLAGVYGALMHASMYLGVTTGRL